jgi:hypothetical protein
MIVLPDLFVSRRSGLTQVRPVGVTNWECYEDRGPLAYADSADAALCSAVPNSMDERDPWSTRPMHQNRNNRELSEVA